MSQGLLQHYKAEGTAYEVAMDEVKFLQFGQDSLTSIGTASLNGCSAVMIVSIHGAIMAHIPPHPVYPSRDLQAGDRHVQKKMQEVASLYIANKQYFATGGNNWIVCAIFQGELALPDQQRIIQDNLNKLGLSYSLATYVAGRKRGGSTFAGQGTVFILGDRNPPLVYVEDKEVSTTAQQSATTGLQIAASYQAASSSQVPYYQASSSQVPHYQASSSQVPYYQASSSQVPYYQASSSQVSYYQASSSQVPSVALPAVASSSTQQSAGSGWTWSAEHGQYYRQLANGSYEWALAQESAGTSSSADQKGKGKATSSKGGRKGRK